MTKVVVTFRALVRLYASAGMYSIAGIGEDS